MARSNSKNAHARTSQAIVEGIDMSNLLDELAERHSKQVPESAITAEMLAEKMRENGDDITDDYARTILRKEWKEGKLQRKRVGRSFYYYEND